MPISTEQAKDLLGSLISLIRTAKARSHRDSERSVSGTKVGVLRIVRHEPARLGDLATRLNVATSVVSRAVDVLEHEGMAERRPDPQDARAVLVTITDEGLHRLSERERRVLSLVADELSEWTPSEADQVINLLQRLDTQVADLFEKLDQDSESAPEQRLNGSPTTHPPTSTSPTRPTPSGEATSAPERTLENINS